jgi:hypothetical protein
MRSTENWKNLETSVSKIVAKAWIDDKFRDRLISEPKEVLREAGIVLGDFVRVIVNQGATGTPTLQGAEGGTIYEINLPPKPVDLIDEQISSWSAGITNLVPRCSC